MTAARFTRLAAVAVILVITCGLASAANVLYTGSATGNFTSGANGTGANLGTSVLGGALTYLGAPSWSCVTDPTGFCAIGAAPATPNVDNFGSITLTDPNAIGQSFNGLGFVLQVNFTAPP